MPQEQGEALRKRQWAKETLRVRGGHMEAGHDWLRRQDFLKIQPTNPIISCKVN